MREQERFANRPTLIAGHQIRDFGVGLQPLLTSGRGLVQLPTNLVDASKQIASGCNSRWRQNNIRFIATGRCGLPLTDKANCKFKKFNSNIATRSAEMKLILDKFIAKSISSVVTKLLVGVNQINR
ncbi:hypothetical protein BV378_19620 [Nostoc sp. RF31YmG]|nr:hypothetical protein BV378_19620 [Nostoc sp. RF31YmG]